MGQWISSEETAYMIAIQNLHAFIEKRYVEIKKQWEAEEFLRIFSQTGQIIYKN